jgi:hypothetical protein
VSCGSRPSRTSVGSSSRPRSAAPADPGPRGRASRPGASGGHCDDPGGRHAPSAHDGDPEGRHPALVAVRLQPQHRLRPVEAGPRRVPQDVDDAPEVLPRGEPAAARLRSAALLAGSAQASVAACRDAGGPGEDGGPAADQHEHQRAQELRSQALHGGRRPAPDVSAPLRVAAPGGRCGTVVALVAQGSGAAAALGAGGGDRREGPPGRGGEVPTARPGGGAVGHRRSCGGSWVSGPDRRGRPCGGTACPRGRRGPRRAGSPRRPPRRR